VKLRYTAHSPADSVHLAARGDLTLPDDASEAAVIGALVNAVERESGIQTGDQMRVIAWRGDDDDPSIWHSWDHG
jgi:hypothetical protein